MRSNDAEAVTARQVSELPVDDHDSPLLVLMYKVPAFTAPTILVPSELTAIALQARTELRAVQLEPESSDT